MVSCQAVSTLLRVSSYQLCICKAEGPGKPEGTCDSNRSRRHQLIGWLRMRAWAPPAMMYCKLKHKLHDKSAICMRLLGQLLCLHYDSNMQTPGACRLHFCPLPGIMGFSCDFVCPGRAQLGLLLLHRQKLCMQITTQPEHNLVHALKGYTCNSCPHTTLVLQVRQQLFMAHHCFAARVLLDSVLFNNAIALAAGAAAYHRLGCTAMLL